MKIESEAALSWQQGPDALLQILRPKTQRQPWSAPGSEPTLKSEAYPTPHPQQLGDDLLADSQLFLFSLLPQSGLGPGNLHLGLLTGPLVFS